MLEITSTRANPMIDPAMHVWGWEIPVYLFLGGIGTALGPFVIGSVSDITGSLQTAMTVPVAGMLVAAVLMVAARRAVVRREDGAATVPAEGEA